MKRCPECRRDYYDDTLLYCLDDGNALLEGPASGRRETRDGSLEHEPATAIMSEPGAVATGFSLLDEPPTAILSKPPAGAGEGFWVAVLPFKFRASDASLSDLAEGLSEDIVAGLSRFSYMRVITRSSTMRYLTEAADVRVVGKELGAGYVIEGSLRMAGSTVRVALHLADAKTGANLWAENYDREFRPESMLELQDDLVPIIVSTLADWFGILPHNMSEAVRLKPVEELSPYEAVVRTFGYYERLNPEEHAATREALERAVKQDPDNADCWAMLSLVSGEEYRYGFNIQPDPLGRAYEAAKRAVDLATENHFARLAIAMVYYYRKEFDAFRNAAERAVALNPMDGYTLARMGMSLAFAGDWKRGCELTERARQLNPNHPGWYWATSFNNAYRKGEYREALSVMANMDMRGLFYHHLNLAAVYGQLGELEAGAESVKELLKLRPNFAVEAREEMLKQVNPDIADHLIEGLRKAGLDIPD
ncbi:MAG: hypothetical protein ACRD6X_13695 [Pyrinomonadaceae bacterium]